MMDTALWLIHILLVSNQSLWRRHNSKSHSQRLSRNIHACSAVSTLYLLADFPWLVATFFQALTSTIWACSLARHLFAHLHRHLFANSGRFILFWNHLASHRPHFGAVLKDRYNLFDFVFRKWIFPIHWYLHNVIYTLTLQEGIRDGLTSSHFTFSLQRKVKQH